MKLRITVHGVAYEVDVEVLDAGEGFAGAALPRASAASLESKTTPPGGGTAARHPHRPSPGRRICRSPVRRARRVGS